MALQYFYGSQAEQFTFYRIPKVLFTDERYRNISMEAKVLYGLMLDRMSLSVENGWTDAQGRVFIIYSIESIMAALGCGNKKVSIYLNELEKGCGLIERKRQGLGLPNIIYVKNFIDNDPAKPQEGVKPEAPSEGDESDVSGDVQADTSRRVHMDTSRNVHVDTSRSVQMTHQDVSNEHANNTERNNTELNDTENSLLFTSFREDAREAKGSEVGSTVRVISEEERAEYREWLEESLEMETLRADAGPAGSEELDEIFELIWDTVCTGRATVRICGEEKPAEIVRSRFLKLNGEHIRYVRDRLRENTTEVRNPKQYLLAMLYNAPMTMGNHYAAMVSHDMAEKQA